MQIDARPAGGLIFRVALPMLSMPCGYAAGGRRVALTPTMAAEMHHLPCIKHDAEASSAQAGQPNLHLRGREL
jgi:hypothetical protein